MTPAISAFDSAIFRNIFGTDAIRAVFNDQAFIGRCVEAEVALALAQQALGVIPQHAGSQIQQGCKVEKLDWERLRKETDVVGYPILPLIRQLEGMCDGDSGKYLHWGATTQDIMDIASILQMKAGLDIIEDQMRQLRKILADLAKKHRGTPMAGRTHLQHALPMTFGYKVAVILAAFDRHQERLEGLKPRCLMVQFGGAAGTLASLGSDDTGLRVRKKMAEILGLSNPPITWHVARDGIAEILSFLSLVGGTLGKVALDIIIMCSDEFNEVQEPFVPHRGASSTMPQKRNPISSEAMLAASKLLRSHAALAQDAMVSDFERASGPWHLEWVVVPEAFSTASAALQHAIFALGGLCVNEARMLKNLHLTRGLIVGEAVMMGLAPKMGRNTAHDVVYAACRQAIEDGEATLLECLKKDPRVMEVIDVEELSRLCDPTNYMGSSRNMVDDVLGNAHQI